MTTPSSRQALGPEATTAVGDAKPRSRGAVDSTTAGFDAVRGDRNQLLGYALALASRTIGAVELA